MKLSSLFQKTLIGQIVLFAFIAASMALASSYSLRWYLTGEYTSKGSAIAKSVAGSQANFSEADSDAQAILQTIVDEFVEVNGVAYVVVVDAEGNPIAQTFEAEVPNQFLALGTIPPQDSGPGLNRFTHSPNFEDSDGDVVVNYRRGSEFGYAIDIVRPIPGGDGKVHVGMDQALMIAQIRAAVRFQLLIMALLFGVSVLATYVMVNRISRPLSQLTDYAQRLANRDFSASVDIRSQDEIGLLACTMENMAADTQQFIQQLESTLKELQQTQAQLVQSAKMSSLGQLVAGMAHEINNPVNFIAGNIRYARRYAESLLELLQLHDRHSQPYAPEITDKIDDIDLDFIAEDFPKAIASMQVGAERIKDIVHSLRNFSRLDEAELKAVNIHDGLDSTLLVLSSRLGKTQGLCAITIEKHYGQLPKIECLAGQLNQAFMNIIGNAIDALTEKRSQLNPDSLPTLTLSTRCLDNAIEIAIADNGIGMAEDLQQRIFDPFFTTKPVGEGSGLGLSISYQIVVQRHGGQIQCGSTPGAGSRFVITLPVTAAKPDLTPPLIPDGSVAVPFS